MSEHSATEHAHDDHNHDAEYIRIWKWLCVLLVISVLGPEIGILWITLLTAFGIALVKAYMVCKHFMHVDMEKPYIHYLMIVSLMLMVLFFTATSPDVMKHEGMNWVNVDAAKEVNARIEAHQKETGATVVNYNEGVLHDPSALWGQEDGFQGYPEAVEEQGDGDAHH